MTLYSFVLAEGEPVQFVAALCMADAVAFIVREMDSEPEVLEQYAEICWIAENGEERE